VPQIAFVLFKMGGGFRNPFFQLTPCVANSICFLAVCVFTGKAHGVDLETMDVSALQRATATTNSIEHTKALLDTVIEQFSHDQSISFVQLKKKRAQQTIMMKNYLMKYSVDGLFCELRDVLETVGTMRLYVETCVLGMIRLAQTKIYQLCTYFDTDDFRIQHMSVKHNGHCSEEYWERASDVNCWRSVILVEINKIVASVAQEITLMQQRVGQLDQHAFVSHTDYAGFYDKDTQAQSGKAVGKAVGKKQRHV